MSAAHCTNSHCFGDSCPNKACDCGCHKTAHVIKSLGPAEACIYRTIKAWWQRKDPRPILAVAIADELRRDNEALADLDSVWRATADADAAQLLRALRMRPPRTWQRLTFLDLVPGDAIRLNENSVAQEVETVGLDFVHTTEAVYRRDITSVLVLRGER